MWCRNRERELPQRNRWKLEVFHRQAGQQAIGRSGAFWHADYFDRYMRDEGHLARTLDYVENNPVRAGLIKIAGEWAWSSARLRKS